MKKSAILASAIAVALAAPLANAAAHGGGGMTVYGKAHVDIRNNDVADNWTVNSNSSRLGFKGSEDLGNGMKVNYKYESTVNITDGGSGGGTFGSARNAYLGMSGDFGEFRIARHDTPAKTALYAAGNERLGDSIIDLHGSFGFAELRADNVIAYVSPNMNGLTFFGAIIPGEGTSAGGDNGLADATSLALMYKGGGIKAGFAVTDAADAAAGANTLDLMNLGGSYQITDMINVGLQYQTVENDALERTAIALTAEFGFGGGNSVALILGNAEDEATGGGTTEADVTGAAFKHKFSKRTTGYIAMVDGDESPNNLSNPWIGNGGTTANGSRYAFGLIHNF